MDRKSIPFSPPDITQEEIDAVVEVMNSGWITSGPKVAQFEKAMCDYCGVNQALTLSSATAGFELVYRVFDIGPGDEAITSPYTYSATASAMCHRGIKPVFVDVKKDSFFIDEQKLYDAITDKTKAIVPVDIAGAPVDYDKIKEVVKAKGREDIILMSDSAHSFGANYKGNKVGGQFDFHVFSFHAVKNLTTAEGGGLTFNDNSFKGKENLIHEFKLNTLHGQSKDALSKMKAGAWKYDIVTDGLKCNMTDIQAALGYVQLKRFDEMVEKRRKAADVYSSMLKNKEWAIVPFSKDEQSETNHHLYPLRIKGFTEEMRDRLIQMMAEENIATNVHFMPLPMFTFYKGAGYNIADYPNAYNQYANEITLPLYSTLKLDDAEFVVKTLIDSVEKIFKSK